MSPEPDRRKIIELATIDDEVRGNLLDGRIERLIEILKTTYPHLEINLDQNDVELLKELNGPASLNEFAARARRRGIIRKK